MSEFATLEIDPRAFEDIKSQLLRAGYPYTANYVLGGTPTIVMDGLAVQPRTSEATQPRDRIGADRLAAAVARLVSNRAIDARSEAADALLDYLDVGGVGGPPDVPTWLRRYEARPAT